MEGWTFSVKSGAVDGVEVAVGLGVTVGVEVGVAVGAAPTTMVRVTVSDWLAESVAVRLRMKDELVA